MFCLLLRSFGVCAERNYQTEKNMKTSNLTEEWDKTFPKSEKVNHSKVTFGNRYGITLAADVYIPKNTSGKLPAIIVCDPYGAVKEQCSGLYAQTMAERGGSRWHSIPPIVEKAAENPVSYHPLI